MGIGTVNEVILRQNRQTRLPWTIVIEKWLAKLLAEPEERDDNREESNENGNKMDSRINQRLKDLFTEPQLPLCR